MDEKTKIYLAGLIDGEGCLKTVYGHRNGYFENKVFRFWLYVGLQEKDGWVLEQLQKETGLGKIYRVKDRDKFHIRWQITSLDEAIRLLEMICPYLRIKQKRAKLMLKVLKIWQKTRHSVKGKRLKGTSTRPVKVIRQVEKILKQIDNT